MSLVLAWGLAPILVHAQPAEPDAAATALPEIRVTASPDADPGTRQAGGFSTEGARLGVLGERPLLDTPFSVNVVTREQLDNAGVRDLKNLARVDPALTPSFSSVGYYDAVSIRGLSLNNWTNYYKNGLLFANQAKTPFENIDRVEVLRGLTGFLQGFAAPGGAVNYVTERPTATWQRRVEMVTDEFGSFLPGFDVGGPLTEDGRLGLRVNAAGGKERYFVERIHTDRSFASLALDWLPLDDVSVKLDAQVDRRDGTTQPSLGLDSNGELPRRVDPARYLGQPWATYDTRTRETGLDVTWRFAPQWSLQARANQARLYRDDFSANIDGLQPNGDFTVYEYKSPDETRHSRNAELVLRGEVQAAGLRHELSLGLSQRRLVARFGDGVYQAVGGSNLHDPVILPDPGSVAPPSYTAFRNRDQGFFVADVIHFNAQWQALVGVRHAKVHFDSVFAAEPYRKSVTTPTLALIHKPAPDVSIYLSHVEGLEQGGTAPNTAANANAQLKPVTAKQNELGVKAQWLDGELVTTAALFEMRQPLAYVDGSSNVYGYYGTRRHRGLELTATGTVRSGTRVNAGLVLLNAQSLNTQDPALQGKVPAGVAERQYTLWVDQHVPQMPGLSAQVGLRGAGRRAVTGDNRVFAPAWTAIDLGLRYTTQWQGQRVQLGLNLLNAGNERYIESSQFGQLLYGSTRALSLNAALAF
jgi:iron complex outermembrane receptor protein